MSKAKPSKKKVVVSTAKTAPTVSRSKANKADTGAEELIFDRQNYLFIALGAALVLIGILLMTGGAQPDPNEWDESIIYGFRQITLAPIVMVIGLVVVVYAIFKK